LAPASCQGLLKRGRITEAGTEAVGLFVEKPRAFLEVARDPEFSGRDKELRAWLSTARDRLYSQRPIITDLKTRVDAVGTVRKILLSEHLRGIPKPDSDYDELNRLLSQAGQLHGRGTFLSAAKFRDLRAFVDKVDNRMAAWKKTAGQQLADLLK
jgi:hypothetical protein